MKSILVVDDSVTDRVRVAGLLRKQSGLSLLTAASGPEALATLQSTDQSIDLILTDLQMPEMSGLQLMTAVHESEYQVPVVIITGVGSEQIAVECIQAGAAGYVCKTDSPDLIRETLQRVLAAKGRRSAESAVASSVTRQELDFCLESQTSLMSATSRHLGEAAMAIGLCSAREMPRLIIAFEEALLNACLHGNLELESTLKEQDGSRFEELARLRSRQDPWQARRVLVHAQLTRQKITVTITDEGAGFDPTTLPDPTLPENLLKPHGRGVMMMRMFVDEVHWNDRGNQITLIKRKSEE